MLKKSQNASLKAQTDKLKERLEAMNKDAEELMTASGIPTTAGANQVDLTDNIVEQCTDHEFWFNFKKGAPMLFCALMENNAAIKQIRDMSFMEELLKVRSMMGLMQSKVEKGDASIDIIEYSMATQMLENKLSVLQALNTTVDGDSDERMTLNVQGTGKAIQIDLTKIKDAISFIDNSVAEKKSLSASAASLVQIDESLSEKEFIKKAVEFIGPIQKNGKVLSKESFIKVFKYSGDFAKIRSKGIKEKAQTERMVHFGDDHKKYLAALQKNVSEEEKAYEQSSILLFDELSISPQMFERSQQALMQDPSIQMELFNLGIKMEQPAETKESDLTKERTIQLVKDSNDFAFDLFKSQYLDTMQKDPMIMPVLISAIAHDWVLKNHNYTEEVFKASLFANKVYEDQAVAQHMQQKQMELMMMAQQQNPYGMMGGPGGGMPGGGMGGGMPGGIGY